MLVSPEMPLGKHKDTLIADLPGKYLNWLAREGLDPPLAALMPEMDRHCSILCENPPHER